MAAENLLEHETGGRPGRGQQAGPGQQSRRGEFSLRETAQLAGVSHNAPYRHFKSKTALIEEVLQKTLVDIGEKILAAPLFYPVSLQLQIQHVGRNIMQLAWRSPKRAHLLFSYQNNDETTPPLAAAFELAQQNLVIVLGESHDLRADSPLDSLALQLLAGWRGLALMHSSGLHGAQIKSEEDLFDLADAMAENILKSFMH